MTSVPLTRPPGPPVPHGPATARPEQRGPVLAGRGLHRRFGAAVALAGVDLALDEGESVAVIGPSGSGKSTLLHCLAGIDAPDHGEVHLDGHRVDALPEPARTALRRHRFGFVFPSGFLLPELPAEENVALPLLLVGHPRRRAVEESRRWFRPLGINGLEGRRPGELSGGEAQRVSIARALVTRPSVVFADEPTATLDRATGRAVMALLLQAARTGGSSVLVVTHDPEVAALCDRTVHLRDGIVAAEAAP